MNNEHQDEVLSAISKALCEKRDKAVNARRSSGIEEIWVSAEEAYLSIDDLNKGDFKGSKWMKPQVMNAPLTSKAAAEDGTRSKMFIPLTRRYVDIAAAKICEIVLPIDDKAFSIKATPVPDMVSNAMARDPLTNQPLTRPATPEELQQGAPAQVPVTAQEVIDKQNEAANTAAEKAEQRIYDWMVEANHPAIMRKVIHDAARIGTGVLKAPWPEAKREVAAATKDDVAGGKVITAVIKESVTPSEKWVDPWNLFPDPSCGSDIRNCDFIFEKDIINKFTLGNLKQNQAYFASQIDKAIKAEADKTVSGENYSDKTDRVGFEIWYFCGTLSREDVSGAISEESMKDFSDSDNDTLNVIATMINDDIVMIAPNPLSVSGAMPYKVFNWQPRAGNWAGVGVGEQVFAGQKIVNGATRAMFNNAGVSSGAQIVIRQGLTPADGVMSITPNKLWMMGDDVLNQSARDLLSAVEIPNVTNQMMSVIQYGFKIAEDSCNIPLISQGQQGAASPATFGAIELQNNNANTLLRSIAYNLDDSITEPLVRGYYEWLLLDPDIPNDEKGDFNINATGSIALVERSIQEQNYVQWLAISGNPAFGINQEKLFKEIIKSKRLNPETISLTDEEKKEAASRPAPLAPAVQAAQIREQGATDRAKIDMDRDTVYQQVMNQRAESDAALQRDELQLRRELAMLDYANKRGITLDQIKADLAKTSMKLNVQRELSTDALTVGLHKHQNPVQAITPAVEPVGRAPDGQAFAQ
jgi:hypothetical protein